MSTLVRITSFLSACTVTISATTALSAPIERYKRERDLSIYSRTHDAYDSDGIRAGNLIIRPTVEAGVEYNDNLYFREEDRISDFKYYTRPNVEVRTDLPLHEAYAGVSGDIAYHNDTTAENYQDARIWAGGSIDATGNIRVPFEVSHERDHQRRRTPDDRRGIEPVVFERSRISGGVNYDGSTVNTSFNANVSDYTFEDTQSSTGIINNDDRNRVVTEASLSVGSSRDGVVAPYVYSRYRDIEYDVSISQGGFNRSASDIEGGVGALINVSSVTRISGSVGYLKRRFTDDVLDDFSTATMTAGITWEPSALMGIELVGERDVRETALIDTSALVETSVDVKAVYELKPNINLEPAIGYVSRDFKGERNRVVDEFSGGIDMRYKLNRNVHAVGSYSYILQDEIEVNRAGISLQLQF